MRTSSCVLSELTWVLVEIQAVAIVESLVDSAVLEELLGGETGKALRHRPHQTAIIWFHYRSLLGHSVVLPSQFPTWVFEPLLN